MNTLTKMIKLTTACTLLLASGSLWAFNCANVQDVPVSECEVLNVMYTEMAIGNSTLDQTIKDQWGSNTDDTVCDANDGNKGVFCSNNSVTQIRLYLVGLSGTIPEELGNLTNLETLSLHSNQLTGSIPAQLGNLTNLEYFYLRNNQLTGSIPTQLGNLTNLEDLYLNTNQLTGHIPAQLGGLANLKRLSLYSNQLIGSIPTQLGNLTSLKHLWLSNNQLTGSIPAQLGDLISLEILSLRNNQLTGSIPTQLGNMTNLRELLLENNQMTGSIPAQLGNLISLEELSLSINHLTGSIPPQLGDLTNLNYLYLNDNQLSGRVPAALADLTNLQRLDLSYNQLISGFPNLINTGMPTGTNRIRIQYNCLDASSTRPQVRDWLDARTTSNTGLDNQYPEAADCKFFWPTVDLISRNGFGLTFNAQELLSAGAEDIDFNGYSINSAQDTLTLTGNTWKMIPYTYEVTENTTLSFSFKADVAEAEASAIGLIRDLDDSGEPILYGEKMLWQVLGTQDWGIPVGNYQIGVDNWKDYCIPVDSIDGGIHYMMFINDDDGPITNDQSASYADISLSETTCTP